MAESEAVPAVTPEVAKEPEEAEKKEVAEAPAGAPAETQDTQKPLENRGVRIHVKNMADTTTTDQLKEMFTPYGEVMKAEAKLDDDGKCKGFGFIVLPTKEEAEKAVQEMNGKTVNEKELTVEIVEPRAKGEGKGKDKGKGKDGKGDAKGKGKGKDKDKGKGKGKGDKGTFTYDAPNPYANAYSNPYANPYANPYDYQAASAAPYAYQAMQMAHPAQAMQMAQMANLQYMQYAQMAQMSAYAQMATMGGSGLWSPAARAAATPLAAALPPPAPPLAPVAAEEESGGKGDKGKDKGSKGKSKGKDKGKGKDKDKEAKTAREPNSNAAPPPPDKEFVGTLKSISDKNSYGFIDCPEARSSYNRDTWVDYNGLPKDVQVGDTLKFNITLSDKGHPRAQRVTAA